MHEGRNEAVQVWWCLQVNTDDMYRIAYGDDIANGNNAEVISLRNDSKKEGGRRFSLMD